MYELALIIIFCFLIVVCFSRLSTGYAKYTIGGKKVRKRPAKYGEQKQIINNIIKLIRRRNIILGQQTVESPGLNKFDEIEDLNAKIKRQLKFLCLTGETSQFNPEMVDHLMREYMFYSKLIFENAKQEEEIKLEDPYYDTNEKYLSVDINLNKYQAKLGLVNKKLCQLGIYI